MLCNSMPSEFAPPLLLTVIKENCLIKPTEFVLIIWRHVCQL